MTLPYNSEHFLITFVSSHSMNFKKEKQNQSQDCGCETVHLRLGHEHLCQDSNPAKTHSLPTVITHLVSGLNEAQVLDVSSQKEFSERQSVR